MQKRGRERSGEENRAKAVAMKKRKTISQLSEMERRAECDGSCCNDTRKDCRSLGPPQHLQTSDSIQGTTGQVSVQRSKREADHQRPSGFILTPSSGSLELKGSAFISSAMLLLPARQPQEILKITGNVFQERVGRTKEITDIDFLPLSICWLFTTKHQTFWILFTRSFLALFCVLN